MTRMSYIFSSHFSSHFYSHLKKNFPGMTRWSPNSSFPHIFPHIFTHIWYPDRDDQNELRERRRIQKEKMDRIRFAANWLHSWWITNLKHFVFFYKVTWVAGNWLHSWWITNWKHDFVLFLQNSELKLVGDVNAILN